MEYQKDDPSMMSGLRRYRAAKMCSLMMMYVSGSFSGVKSAVLIPVDVQWGAPAAS